MSGLRKPKKKKIPDMKPPRFKQNAKVKSLIERLKEKKKQKAAS